MRGTGPPNFWYIRLGSNPKVKLALTLNSWTGRRKLGEPGFDTCQMLCQNLMLNAHWIYESTLDMDGSVLGTTLVLLVPRWTVLVSIHYLIFKNVIQAAF